MNPQLFAVQFSHAVEAFADADATEQQKAALRALVALLKTEGITIKSDRGRISVGGESVNLAGIESLAGQLAGHAIGEIHIASGAPAADLFNLLKAVASRPGSFPPGDGVEARLRHSGVHSIALLPALPLEGPGPAAGSAAATELGIERSAEPELEVRPTTDSFAVERASDPFLDSAAAARSSDAGITRADDFALDHGAEVGAPPSPAAFDASVAPGSRPPAPDDDLMITHSTEDFAAAHEAMTAATRPAPPPAPPPAPLALTMDQALEAGPVPAAKPAAAKGTLEEVVRQIGENPNVPNLGDLLARAGAMIEEALRRDRHEQALSALHSLIDIEGRIPEGSERRQFGIALRRTVTREVLQAAARLVPLPAHTPTAVVVLQRAGADGIEVLLDLLIAAPTAVERRIYFDALRNSDMREGAKLLVHHLSHHEWFVVRNVAELVGELGVEEALPQLTKLLGHHDVRVRKAAALAVAKIGTPKSLDALRRALRDESVEVRTQAAVGIGGRKSSALAMPLVVTLGEEKDPAMQRELVLALGRIGTPDAVQALIKVAEPGGSLFNRKPSALRVAAVEALALVATPAARGMIQGLANDGDRDVRDAAQRALRLKGGG